MATTMIDVHAGHRRQPPSAGRWWVPAVLCGVGALSFAGWTMAISWSVASPVWWQEASARLVGAFVVVLGVVMWIRRPTPRMGQVIVLGGAVYYFQYLRVDPARFDQIPTQVRVAVGLYAGAKAAAEQVAAEQAALDPE